MSSDHDHASGDHQDSHDAHPVATDVIPESSVQDLILKGLTIAVAGLLYFMAFSWMGVPLPESSHEAGHESQEAEGHSAPAASEHH